MQYTKVQMASLLYAATDDVDDADGDDGDDDDDNDDDNNNDTAADVGRTGRSRRYIVAPKLARCKAIYDYDAQDADELSSREGEIIEIIEESKTPILCHLVIASCCSLLKHPRLVK